MTESLDWIGNQRALQGYGEEGDRATSNEEGEASATKEETAATKNIQILTRTSLSSVIKVVH